ncbi:MAG: hypothetical protein MZW92_44750 [Comamonadaceae bacterium]|nr:hypothetical protein [Comamonadaceae bacterium]
MHFLLTVVIVGGDVRAGRGRARSACCALARRVGGAAGRGGGAPGGRARSAAWRIGVVVTALGADDRRRHRPVRWPASRSPAC